MQVLSQKLRSWTRWWLVLALFAALAIYIALTLPALQSAPGGTIASLDAQLYYTPDQAFATVSAYGDAASFWIRMYLTWDVATPILYSLAFSLLISWLSQRSVSSASRLHMLNLLPIAAGLTDLLENASIVTMLAVYPSRPVAIAWFSTAFTLSKMAFLVLSVLVILVGLVVAASKRFRVQS